MRVVTVDVLMTAYITTNYIDYCGLTGACRSLVIDLDMEVTIVLT
jgi:hypothetical protein